MNREPLVTLPPRLLEPNPDSASAAAQATGRRARAQADARCYVLGVDGGATKTLAAVLRVDERTLHLGQSGPSNEDAVGARRAVKALLDASDQALARAGISTEDLAAAVLAVAGTDTSSVDINLREMRSDDWIVVNDVVSAWASATGVRPGVGVISGTGSNVFGVGPNGRAWRAGGWGHLLGDEGSGYWLGAQSIKAALRDRDGSGPATALSDASLRFFGAPTVEALAASIYATPLTKGEVAAFAVETAKLANDGDPVARALYAHAASELGEQINAVVAQTGLSGRFPIGLLGSAFKAGSVFVQPLAEIVHASAPEADVFAVEMAPVGGSLLLAMRACGCAATVGRTELTRLINDATAA